MGTSPSELREHALAAVQPVLPLEPAGKRPLGGLGLPQATRDADTIGRWWEKWPDANLGLRCDGLLVVDVDGETGEESLERLKGRFGRLPATRASRTGKGRHLLFATPILIGNSTAPLGRPPGIDLRGGARGYIVAPPSTHASGHRYEWVDERPPVLLPDGWREPLTAPLRVPITVGEGTTETGYGRSALASELERLLNACPGERNEQLNMAVFRLGQLVAGGQLTRFRVEESAQRVGRLLGLSPRECRLTVRSAIAAGLGFPRVPSRVRVRARDNRVSIGSSFNPVNAVVVVTPVAGDIPDNPGIAVAGDKRKTRSNDYARATEKSPLDLFAKQPARTRRTKRPKKDVVPHLRHGRFSPGIERMLARERPVFAVPDDDEIERLLAKHADIAEGRYR